MGGILPEMAGHGFVSQKRMAGSLEPELQVVVSCLMWALETELWFSRKAASTLNC